LTLDEDVAAALARLQKARDTSYKEVVNETLRLGLRQMTAKPDKKRKPFQMRTIDSGECRLTNVDNIGEVLSIIEGDWHK
jgi:hypothetical protein